MGDEERAPQSNQEKARAHAKEHILRRYQQEPTWEDMIGYLLRPVIQPVKDGIRKLQGLPPDRTPSERHNYRADLELRTAERAANDMMEHKVKLLKDLADDEEGQYYE